MKVSHLCSDGIKNMAFTSLFFLVRNVYAMYNEMHTFVESSVAAICMSSLMYLCNIKMSEF